MSMGSFDCWRCWKEARDRGEVGPFSRVMQLCPICGNKRCPKATDHRLECSGSNEAGQAGSIYQQTITAALSGGLNVEAPDETR